MTTTATPFHYRTFDEGIGLVRETRNLPELKIVETPQSQSFPLPSEKAVCQDEYVDEPLEEHESEKLTLQDVNQLGLEDFSALLGPLFEKTPGVVEETWRQSPFTSLEAIYIALCNAAMGTAYEMKMKLLRSFPDFLLELQVNEENGEITSASHWSGMGPERVTLDEYSRIFHLNGAYRGIYGIPFILYLPEHQQVESVFETFALRLQNRRDEEVDVALEEGLKFAWLRLALFVDPGSSAYEEEDLAESSVA
jgi:2-oxo-4-hydroxy-4-carboxy-5-ureidoimidazoline decarboxylase